MASVWDTLQAVGPLSVTPTPGGSVLRWVQVDTVGCGQLKAFLRIQPEMAQRLILLQNGARIEPDGYADLVCDIGGKITEFTFTFKPRTED